VALLRKPTAIGVILLGCGLLAAVAVLVLTTQTRARSDLEHELSHRAQIAAHLVSGAMTASTRNATTAPSFSGPDRDMPAALRSWETPDPDPQSYVLAADGRLLASYPRHALGTGLVRSGPDVRAALAGRLALSNVLRAGSGHPLLSYAVPLATPHGRRVLVAVISVSQISEFVGSFFPGAPAVAGSSAYVVDGNGRMLAFPGRGRVGDRLAVPGLLALLRHARSGRLGDDFVVSSAIRSTPWRVVFVTPRAELYRSLEAPRRTALIVFAGFALALLGLFATGLRSLSDARRLAAATERATAASRLAHERLHDTLTGLPNRALFLDRLEQVMAGRARDPLSSSAVLFLDLDRFKRINDSLGHAFGDEVLRTAADRLRATVRPQDTVCRFGGDEFLLLCPDLLDADDALRIAERAQRALGEPLRIEGRDVRVTSSVGIAVLAPGDSARKADSLIRDADAAMYRAKERGGGGAELFDVALHREAVARLGTEAALRTAAVAGELRLHYQPIVELPSGTVVGAEALVRWERPGHGLLEPGAFIPLAEETGLVVGIGAWVLDQAMADAAEWAALGLIDEDFTLSVNLSRRQLAGTLLAPSVGRLVAGWRLPPRVLCLEVTETAVTHDLPAAERTLRALTDLGVRVAIDDFGIGQSSLERLGGTLPVDVLKLDRSFVSRIEHARERAIVSAVGMLARDLEMTSVAEGIETPEQATAVADFGYARGQGFWFGRPEAAPAFVTRLAALTDRPTGRRRAPAHH